MLSILVGITAVAAARILPISKVTIQMVPSPVAENWRVDYQSAGSRSIGWLKVFNFLYFNHQAAYAIAILIHVISTIFKVSARLGLDYPAPKHRNTH